METDVSVGKFYDDNIVTFWQGKKTTKFQVSLSDLPITITESEDKKRNLTINSTISFENIITAGKLTSQSHKITLYSKELTDTEFDELKIIKDWLENLKSSIKKWKILNISYINNSEEITNSDQPLQIRKKSLLDNEVWRFFMSLKNWLFTNFSEQRNNDWIFEPEISSKLINDFVTKIPKSQQAYEQILKRLKKSNTEFIFDSFTNATFPLIIADIQRSSRKEQYQKNLELYTDWLIKDVYIHIGKTDNNLGNNWVPYVQTPNAPKELASISMGSAILVYFITLKCWLELAWYEKSYSHPSVMLLDEIDSFIHPTLLPKLSEILRWISRQTQLFITTHSPIFIDLFSKENIFYIKPIEKIWKITLNRSDIFSYKQIIDSIIDDSERKMFIDMPNSELFINWIVEDLYPV